MPPTPCPYTDEEHAAVAALIKSLRSPRDPEAPVFDTLYVDCMPTIPEGKVILLSKFLQPLSRAPQVTLHLAESFTTPLDGPLKLRSLLAGDLSLDHVLCS